VEVSTLEVDEARIRGERVRPDGEADRHAGSVEEVVVLVE
jgi:hypothetical protein